MVGTLFKAVRLVNEGSVFESDLRIEGDRIVQIASYIAAQPGDQIVEAHGCYLLPGMIDDQVHFREPGLVHKGTIATESRAAVAGGITSFMEMPNVSPATTSIESLEYKFELAASRSVANYSFYLGATQDNIEQIKQLDPKQAQVKSFAGASTGDLLVEDPGALDLIFQHAPTLIATHCESGRVIKLQNERAILGAKDALTIEDHPRLDVEACFAASEYAVGLANKHSSQLHVLHITTAKELDLFFAGAD